MTTAAATLSERLGLARLASWRPLSPHDDELLLVPKDLRAADPTFASEIAAGQMGLGGAVATFDDRSPFEIAAPSAAWAAELHGFGWLRHLKAARTPQATAAARKLFDDWTTCDRDIRRRTPGAFAPEVAARRVSAWLANADLLLDGANPTRFGQVHRALATAIRVLDGNRATARGWGLIVCDIALVTASLALADHERHLERRESALLDALARQILDDGGHHSRNPDVVVELLIDLLPLRQCYLARGRTPPATLIDATGRMLGFLRAMQLGSGALARFHGSQGGTRDALATVLALDAGVHDPRHTLAQSRFVRLEQGRTVVIMDCGGAAPDVDHRSAFCSPLAFEMSSGRRRILGNGGAPSGVVSRIAAEAAAAIEAHATLGLGAGIRPGPALVSAPAIEADNDQISVAASHGAFVAAFGLVHNRCLALRDGGRSIEGRDRLDSPAGVLRTARDVPFAIRFHLDKAVTATVDLDGGRALITLDDAETWELTVTGARAGLEPGIDYTHAGDLRAAEQIVLRGTCPGQTQVIWTLTRRH